VVGSSERARVFGGRGFDRRQGIRLTTPQIRSPESEVSPLWREMARGLSTYEEIGSFRSMKGVKKGIRIDGGMRSIVSL